MHRDPSYDLLLGFLAINRAIGDELRAVRRLLHERAAETKYNPNWRLQPRAPRGTSEGGQWVDGGGAGDIPKSGPNRDRPGPGHNRPPPETLHQIFPALQNAPASAVLAPIDGFLGISRPGLDASESATRNLGRQIISDTLRIDPSYRPPATAEPGGFPSTITGRNNLLNNLRADRAAVIYRVRGETGPLQVETLRFVQQRVDRAYAQAVRLYDSGQLPRRLSREEAIGNYIDQTVRRELRAFYNSRRLSPSRDVHVRVNRRDYNTSETDATYRVPDARVGTAAFDWTLRQKMPQTAQIRGFFAADARPTVVIIVRPSQLGRDSTYLITRPRD